MFDLAPCPSPGQYKVPRTQLGTSPWETSQLLQLCTSAQHPSAARCLTASPVCSTPLLFSVSLLLLYCYSLTKRHLDLSFILNSLYIYELDALGQFCPSVFMDIFMPSITILGIVSSQPITVCLLHMETNAATVHV